MTLKQQLVVVLGLLAALLSTYVVYSSAFIGPFIFDDIPNLTPLGYFGGVTDWPSALYFIFGNGSGTLGRGLSMASFLINDTTWPSDPASFKYTNTLIHLLNGVLVFQLSRMVGKEVGFLQKQKEYFALIAAIIWIAHPIQTSAVIFVVQRMTLLSSTFELLACIAFLQYRHQLHTVAGAFKAAAIVGLLIGVGVLAKENAVMAIYFIAALEFFVVRQASLSVRAALLVVCCLGVGVVVYLGFNNPLAWSRRSFDMGERLLTESRVLWDYLSNFFFPRPADFSLFNDDYVISRSLFNPISTVLALLGWVAAIGGIFFFKRKNIFISLALSWFLLGHLLESTVIPLELYFDHRNYLPILGFCWLIANGILKLPVPVVGKYGVTGLVFLLIFFISHTVLRVWQSEPFMARIWGVEHPKSTRAQQLLVRDALNLNDISLARRSIDAGLSSSPNDPLLALQKLIIVCIEGEQESIDKYRLIVRHGKHSNGVREGLTKVRNLVEEKKCWLASSDLEALYSDFSENKNFKTKDDISFINIERARLATSRGDLNAAMSYLDLAYAADPTNIQFPLTQTYWLVDSGLFGDAEKYLAVAENTKPPHRMQIFQYRKLAKKARDYFDEKRNIDAKNLGSNPR